MRVLFRGLIIEGVAGAGKSSLLRALLADPLFTARVGASAVVLSEHHTQRVLEGLGPRGELAVADNLKLLREHTDYLRGLHGRLSAMKSWDRHDCENPRTLAVLERFHLSHVLSYQHLRWSDVRELDRALGGLELTLCVVTASPEELRRRLRTRGASWGSFLSEPGQSDRLGPNPSLEAVADYFVRQQDELLELSTRSALSRMVVDTTQLEPDAAAQRVLRAVLGA